MLEYVLFVIGIDALIAAFAIRRTGLISPLSIWCVFNTLCLFYFFYTQNLGIIPVQEYSAMPIYGLEQYSIEVANIFLLLNTMAFLTLFTLRRAERVRPTVLFGKLRAIFSTTMISLFALVMLVMTLIHLLDFDLRYLWSYQGYHGINELGAVGITNPVAQFYHRLGPTLAAIAACMAVVAFHTRRPQIGTALFALACYGFVLALASSSREMAVIIGLATFTDIFIRKRIALWDWLGIAAAAFSLLFALTARSRFGMQGFGHFFENAGNITFESIPTLLVGLISNVAQGATGLANSLRFLPQYPFDYIFTSMFSPLPGNIDGHEEIQSMYQVKITQSNPMGALSEAYHFGPLYFGWLLFVTMLILRHATISITRQLTFMSLPMFGLAVLLIYRLHHYTLRISNRLILLFLVVVVLDLLLRARKRRSSIDLTMSARRGGSGRAFLPVETHTRP